MVSTFMFTRVQVIDSTVKLRSTVMTSLRLRMKSEQDKSYHLFNQCIQPKKLILVIIETKMILSTLVSWSFSPAEVSVSARLLD